MAVAGVSTPSHVESEMRFVRDHGGGQVFPSQPGGAATNPTLAVTVLHLEGAATGAGAAETLSPRQQQRIRRMTGLLLAAMITLLLGVAYMPYKVTGHRVATDLLHPQVVGYRRHPFLRDFWRYVDIDMSRLP